MLSSNLPKKAGHNAIARRLNNLTWLAPLIVGFTQCVAQAQTPQQTPSTQHLLLCPDQFEPLPQTNKQSLRQLLTAVRNLSLPCDTRADYHAHLGGLLLQDGQFEAAAESLEKSLLLSPEQPGTQLDYAHALALLGDKLSAQHIVKQVSARSDIDPGLRKWLQSTRSDDPLAQAQWSLLLLMQTTAGHESNLTSATNARDITLILPNGPVVVPLDPSSKAQKGFALKTLFGLQAQSPIGAPDLRLSLAFQTRRAEKTQDNHFAAASATYAMPLDAGQARLRWDIQQSQANGKPHFRNQSLGLQYHFAINPTPCQWHVAISSAEQSYASSPELDGRLSQVRLESSCKHTDQSATHWGIGSGHDRAKSEQRPGGNKSRQDWGVRHDRTIGRAATQVWLRQTAQQDSERFSPLLGDLVSANDRTDWGVGAWWPWLQQWQLGFEVESTSQKSSNTLFNIRNLSIYTGIRWQSN